MAFSAACTRFTTSSKLQANFFSSLIRLWSLCWRQNLIRNIYFRSLGEADIDFPHSFSSCLHNRWFRSHRLISSFVCFLLPQMGQSIPIIICMTAHCCCPHNNICQFAKPINWKKNVCLNSCARVWTIFSPFILFPLLSHPLFPCRHALNIKYKLETITVNKMLSLKFRVPAPNDILLTVVIESHTPQRENKILWCPGGGKNQNRFHSLSLSLCHVFIG